MFLQGSLALTVLVENKRNRKYHFLSPRDGHILAKNRVSVRGLSDNLWAHKGSWWPLICLDIFSPWLRLSILYNSCFFVKEICIRGVGWVNGGCLSSTPSSCLSSILCLLLKDVKKTMQATKKVDKLGKERSRKRLHYHARQKKKQTKDIT